MRRSSRRSRRPSAEPMSETFDVRDFLSPEVEDRVDALELPFNKHGIDPYGVSKSDLALFFSVLGKAYKDYFHV